MSVLLVLLLLWMAPAAILVPVFAWIILRSPQHRQHATEGAQPTKVETGKPMPYSDNQLPTEALAA
jgi:hypothetical protein